MRLDLIDYLGQFRLKDHRETIHSHNQAMGQYILASALAARDDLLVRRLSTDPVPARNHIDIEGQ